MTATISIQATPDRRDGLAHQMEPSGKSAHSNATRTTRRAPRSHPHRTSTSTGEVIIAHLLAAQKPRRQRRTVQHAAVSSWARADHARDLVLHTVRMAETRLAVPPIESYRPDSSAISWDVKFRLATPAERPQPAYWGHLAGRNTVRARPPSSVGRRLGASRRSDE